MARFAIDDDLSLTESSDVDSDSDDSLPPPAHDKNRAKSAVMPTAPGEDTGEKPRRTLEMQRNTWEDISLEDPPHKSIRQEKDKEASESNSRRHSSQSSSSADHADSTRATVRTIPTASALTRTGSQGKTSLTSIATKFGVVDDFVWTTKDDGSTIDVDTPENRLRIVSCVERGDLATLEVLLAKGVDPNMTISGGSTALITAILKRDMDAILLLISSPKLDWNLRDEFKQTPLIAACKQKGDTPLEENTLFVIAKLLLDHKGLKIDELDASGTSALLYAVARRDYRLTELLIDHNANIDRPNLIGVTPLMTAAMNHDEAMCLYLIRKGADIERTNKAGKVAADLVEEGPLKQLLLGRKTTLSHPLKVRYVDSAKYSNVLRGKLAYVRPPGGCNLDHHRSLLKDLEVLHNAGCHMLVTLLPKTPQLANLSLSETLLAESCRKWNIEWVYLPIDLPGLIAGDEWLKYTDLVLDWLMEGKNVCLHCDFERERSVGLFAATLVRFKGFDDSKAIDMVREFQPKYCKNLLVSHKLFLSSFHKKKLAREKKEKEEFAKRLENPERMSFFSNLAQNAANVLRKRDEKNTSSKPGETRDATFIV